MLTSGSSFFICRKALRSRSQVVGGNPVNDTIPVDGFKADASCRLLATVASSSMASYQFRAILLLFILITNTQFNMAMFDQPDPQSREQMETSPTCFLRPYTFKVKQDDSQGRSCWDTVTVTSCWGRCDSNEVKSYSYF